VTDVTTSPERVGAVLSAADEQLLRELTERARAGGLQLTGERGLLGTLTKMVIEGALEGELDDHLGYEKNDPAGRDGGNSRNGHRAKTVLTDTRPVEITVPRDRDSSFEPRIIAQRQRRLTGVDEMVISLSACVILSFRVTRCCDLRRPVMDMSLTGRSRPDGRFVMGLDCYLIGSVLIAGRRVRGRAGGGAGRCRRRVACCGRGRW
jgi:hypothetical protein